MSALQQWCPVPIDSPQAVSPPYWIDEVSWRLAPDLTGRLRELARKESASLFSALVSGWAILQARVGTHEQLLISVELMDELSAGPPSQANCEQPFTLILQLSESATVHDLLLQLSDAFGSATSAFGPPLDELDASSGAAICIIVRPCTGDTIKPEARAQACASDSRNHAGRPVKDSELSLLLRAAEAEVIVTLQYAAELFPEATIHRWREHWNALLEGMCSNTRLAISQLPLLTLAQRQEVLCCFNSSTNRCTNDLLFQLFERQAARKPEAIAIAYEGALLTYSALNRRANRVAALLREKGVGPDLVVGLCFNRGLDAVVSLLGILKSGAAFLPLDPSYPAQRLAYMLRTALPRLLLTQKSLKGLFPDFSGEIFELDTRWVEIAKQADENPDPVSLGLTPQDLAYIVYTSGSTGTPKAIAAEHRGMCNRILAQEIIAPFSADDICCHKTSIGFVDSIFEILGPLSYGCQVVIAPSAASKDVTHLASLLERERITRLITVPSLARALLESPESSFCLRHIRGWTLSGEQLQLDLLKELQSRLPNCVFMNIYGSSEVSADATFYVSNGLESAAVPIGRPLPNTRIYVLDQHQEPTPIGVAGEIYVAGLGVARGYLNRPDLTGERFTADPFSNDSHGRMYKSGDLGRWRPDGLLDYLGRADRQIKIRGFRIEPGEIESRLTLHPAVREAVVIACANDRGEQQLAAYVSTRNPESLNTGDLRSYLQSFLPDYMIPGSFEVLPSLPRTHGGKLDRHALTNPSESGTSATHPYEAPRGPREQFLATIWQELLGAARIDRHDNFVALGGHSLLVVRMLERLRTVGLAVEVERILSNATLADVASFLTSFAFEDDAVLTHIPVDCESITPEMVPLLNLSTEDISLIVRSTAGGTKNIQDIYPLTPLQEGMLFHHIMDSARGDTYVVSIVLSLSSKDKIEELVAALQRVIDRHEVLRTAVIWDRLTQPVQVVWRSAMLPVEELVVQTDRALEEQIDDWTRPGRQRMDLRRAPLMALQISADAHHRLWYAVIRIHHMVCDDVSLRIVISEVAQHLQGTANTLADPQPYRLHVEQTIRHNSKRHSEAFFREKLAGIDEPTAPFGLLDVRGDSCDIEEAHQEIPPLLARQILNQARRSGVTPATMFHAAWALVVARTSGRDDVVFGTVLLGRLLGLSETVGMFINTLPLRLDLEGLTAKGLVERTHRELVALLAHEQASLVAAQRSSQIQGEAPLFSAVINYRHRVYSPDTDFASTDGIEFLRHRSCTNYPVALSVDDTNHGFDLTVQTKRPAHASAVLSYLQTALEAIVEALDKELTTPALMLPVLPDKESRAFLTSFSAVPVMSPVCKTVHELFEEQVTRTPMSVAAVFGAKSLTYTDLNAKANRLARHLRSKGVGPDHLVAICTDRDLEMLVALLGVLKAGAAYVPIDPTYPKERLEFMLADCAPRVLLTQCAVRGLLPHTSAEIIVLDEESDEITQQDARDLSPSVTGVLPTHLAYVIYTSGSTGQPKGVMITHTNILRLFTSTAEWFQFDKHDVWTLFHSFSFDFSVWEIWGALLHGGRLVVVPYLTSRSPQQFYRLLCDERVTVLNQTPSAFSQLIDAQHREGNRPHSLRIVIFGGEALEFRALLPWAQRNGVQQPRLVNMYGITETTVHVTYHPVTESEIRSESASLIGSPIPDLAVYLLDSRQQPVPVGVTGELHVGGAGVARGYLNRQELTRERFVDDPFSPDSRAKMYKTGDLGRRRPDGTIEYLGRNDHQIKLRGFRIELGEIETQLCKHALIREARVLAREDEPGDKRLVAYVVATPGQERPRIESLRTHLMRVLPQHMIPAAFVLLEALPLTSNGKLDRHALPVPEMADYRGCEYEAPRGELEVAVAKIWQKILRKEVIGRWDNFFEHGGHSLLATRVVAHISHVLEVDIPIHVLFERPTISALSEYIAGQLAAEIAAEAP